MKKPTLALQYALAAVAANPILTHMRSAVYYPVTIPTLPRNDTLHLQKAEEKRLRKQQKYLSAIKDKKND